MFDVHRFEIQTKILSSTVWNIGEFNPFLCKTTQVPIVSSTKILAYKFVLLHLNNFNYVAWFISKSTNGVYMSEVNAKLLGATNPRTVCLNMVLRLKLLVM